MRYLIALLAVAGIVVSSLALHVHNMDPAQAPPCAVDQNWDCGAVNHSRFAEFPPVPAGEDPRAWPGHRIPIAAIGIVGYALIGIFALLGKRFTTMELAQMGLACALGLSYAEKFILERWCIYCVWSQWIIAVIAVLAIVDVWRWRRRIGLWLER